jgi:serine/threonine-protein kinase RsbW
MLPVPRARVAAKGRGVGTLMIALACPRTGTWDGGLAQQFSSTHPGMPGEVPRARAALRRLLPDGPLADDALLVATELMSNALVHSRSGAPGGEFVIRLVACQSRYVRVEVEDQGGPWAPRDRGSEGGRGLTIVAALAGPANWGVEGDEDGRLVWVRLAWPTGEASGETRSA